MDTTPLDDQFDRDGWEETHAAGWVRRLGTGRLLLTSIPGGGMAIAGAGGPQAGIVMIQAEDVAELAAVLQHVAATGQPPPIGEPSHPPATDAFGRVEDRCPSCQARLYLGERATPICLNGCRLSGGAYRRLVHGPPAGRT